MLDKEYNNMRDILELYAQQLDFTDLFNKIPVYAQTKYKNLWVFKSKNQSIELHNKSFRIEKNKTTISKYWLRFPTKQKRGGIWLAIKPHQQIPEDVKLCDSKLIKKGNTYWFYLSIKKEVPEILYSNITAIDLGEKVIACVCGTSNKRPLFLGREVRGLRRHYAWLRKRFGERKLMRMIKKVGQKEQRRVDEVLHKVAKEIVEISLASNSIIFLGNLKGIRKSAKGRRFNRIVANMPYYKLTQMIEYKAAWVGIRVIKINERGTSKSCSRCGLDGLRRHQGLFKCHNCGYEVNADFNGVQNILKRSCEQVLQDGAIAFSPETNLKRELVSTINVQRGGLRRK